MRRLLCLFSILAGQATTQAARAADPKWEYGKATEVKAVEWKASAQLGFVLNTGNANTVSVAAGGLGSRFDGKNRVLLEVGGSYAKSTILVGNDMNMDGAIGPGEIGRLEKTVASLWSVKARYDRFLTLNNSIYVTAFTWGNEPAGKIVVAGGQVGYARQLYKSDWHLLAVEAGYDYSYEHFVAMVPDIHIHSLRFFFAYGLALSKDTSLNADVEVLCNMNPLDGGPYGEIGPFADTRVIGKAALNTRLWKALSFRFGFKAIFDNAPPPAPALGLPYLPGFFPRAEKLDTVTEAALIINFI
jgi:hypothetical protein